MLLLLSNFQIRRLSDFVESNKHKIYDCFVINQSFACSHASRGNAIITFRVKINQTNFFQFIIHEYNAERWNEILTQKKLLLTHRLISFPS